ncbi:MAG: sodium:proton antiporter [Pseudomonadales bacterium]|nr:sodium:proton antiporter [Pseudomonadales bacterium]
MDDHLLYIMASIVVLGVLAQWLSWRLRLPSILALLILGLVAGPATGLLQPDLMFGDLLFPLISLGVALVLFEGGLTLKLEDIRGHGAAVTHMVTWGALLNVVLIAGGVWCFTAIPGMLALLFASLVVVTGPTVISPLLRTVRPNSKIRHILHWEGILIDPLGALLAVLVFQFISVGSSVDSLGFFVQGVLVGMTSGVAVAAGLGFLLRRHWVPEYLQNALTLAAVILAFAGSQYLANESGLLAVTIMGMWLGNIRGLDTSEILNFKESLSVLIISILFIVLAARVDIEIMLATGWDALVLIVIITVARFLVVWLATLRQEYSWQEKFLIAWIGPRGIVAAAVSSLFAVRMEALGYQNSELLVTFTFLVIIGTVVLQSFTARPLAKLLGLVEDEPKGILIVGANPVARTIGKALQSLGFTVKVTDTSWTEIQAARMDGLDTYFGNPVSAHADRHLDLVGIGRLFAMSQRSALNMLACLKYRSEFGRQRVFTLRNAEEKETTGKYPSNDPYHGQRLFGKDVSMEKLAALIAQGAQVKVSLLTENYDWDAYQRRYGDRAVPLFGLDGKDHLRAFTDGFEPKLQAGWRILALVPAELLAE